MFLTTHAAAGIFISQHVHNPLAVFGLSFASHFVLDFVPHGDEHLYRDEEWKILKRFRRPIFVNAIDLVGLLALTLWAVSRPLGPSTNLMAIGILGSILPDLLSYLFPVVHERFSWLGFVRWFYSATKPTGLRYIVRSQNWLHRILHHELIQRDIPFAAGLTLQAALVAALLLTGFR